MTTEAPTFFIDVFIEAHPDQVPRFTVKPETVNVPVEGTFKLQWRLKGADDTELPAKTRFFYPAHTFTTPHHTDLFSAPTVAGDGLSLYIFDQFDKPEGEGEFEYLLSIAIGDNVFTTDPMIVNKSPTLRP